MTDLHCESSVLRTKKVESGIDCFLQVEIGRLPECLLVFQNKNTFFM